MLNLKPWLARNHRRNLDEREPRISMWIEEVGAVHSWGVFATGSFDLA